MSTYADHNAATPMPGAVIKAMLLFMEDERVSANPSSLHSWGSAAREALEDARIGIAASIGGKPEEIVFTSGGTEGNNAIINGVFAAAEGPVFLITSPIEHKSILRPAAPWLVEYCEDVMRVTKAGFVDVDHFEQSIEGRFATALVSVMHANNETGVIQPVNDIACVISGREDWLLHVDACQSLGKIPVDVNMLGADYVTLSSHKCGGPKGIGAIWIRDGAPFEPFILGGHQEGDRRAGTENVIGAIGFAKALAMRISGMKSATERQGHLVAHLVAGLRSRIDGMTINGEDAPRLPNTINIRFEGIDSEALVLMLSEAGFYVSNGSACESGTLEGSHVLRAMGQTDEQSRSAIRFSFGSITPLGDMDRMASAVADCVTQLRAVGTIPF